MSAADAKTLDLSDVALAPKFLEVRGLKTKINAFKKELKASSIKFESAQIDEIIKIAGPYFVSDADKDEIRLDLFKTYVIAAIKEAGGSYDKEVLTTKKTDYNLIISLDAVESEGDIVVFYNDFKPKKTKKDERISAAIAKKDTVQLKDLVECIKTH
jgi:hypothetical protein